MIHSIGFSNFQSFAEWTQIDFDLSKKIQPNRLMSVGKDGVPTTKIMAIIGGNGSGKTSILKVPSFLAWFVSNSFSAQFDSPIPIAPHFSKPEQPSDFEVILDFEGITWKYALTCTSQRVLNESLFQKKDRFGYLFQRDWNPITENYEIKQKGFGFAPSEAKQVRQNASVISTAAQYGHPLATRIVAAINKSIMYNVNATGKFFFDQNLLQIAAKHFSENEEQAKLMSEFLKTWDLGISSVHIEHRQIVSGTSSQSLWMPVGNHTSQIGEHKLDFFLESSGTQAAFVLLWRILFVLSVGGIAIIDEFESDLHPFMLKPILDLFSSETMNPKGAQIILSTHAIQILNLLNKGQVTLVQKDSFGESQSIRMDRVEGIRNDDNLYSKYMSGAYGAVPDL